MHLLFSYGDLQRDEIQIEAFGRLLVGLPDYLPSCVQVLIAINDPAIRAATGKTHHANLHFSRELDSRVSGIAYEVTPGELLVADQFEAEFSYCRVSRRLASGRDAWVYVHAE